MLIDTHCHLNFQAFENDIEEVINSAKKDGVEKIIIPGAKIDSSEKAIAIANKHDGCYAAIGIHPHHIYDYYDTSSYHSKNEEIKKLLLGLANKNKVIAIGECGLDYFEYQKSVHPENIITPQIKEQQKELLKIHLEVAIECNLPVILHCREAFVDMLPIVEEHNKVLRGVFHCFGGSEKDLEKVLAMGFYVGFDGNITFKNADNLRFLVKLSPLDKILIETDSPYLTPEPYRGKRNEPKNVKIVAQCIAQIKNISQEEVEKETTINAVNLFLK